MVTPFLLPKELWKANIGRQDMGKYVPASSPRYRKPDPLINSNLGSTIVKGPSHAIDFIDWNTFGNVRSSIGLFVWKELVVLQKYRF